jgi:DNA-binding MarR family transcriptional regulator
MEMFFQLVRVNAAIRAEIDASLLAKHGLTFEDFDAMTVIAGQPEGCGELALAGALGLTRDEARATVDSLIGYGYVSPTTRPEGVKPQAVMLTLRGRLVLSRAGRVVDRALDRRIASALSRQELSRLERALGELRQRPVAEEPVSGHGAAGDERRLATDA